MLRQVQFEVLVASHAENFLRLDDLGRQTVAVTDALRAGASLNKLGRDSKLAQVSLLFNGVGTEDFKKLRHCSFR